MKIKIGFRRILIVWATATVAAVLIFAQSQNALFENQRQNDRIERVFAVGTQLVQLTYEVLFYGEARAIEQWRQQFSEVDAAVHDFEDGVDPALRGTLDALFRRFEQLRPVQERLTEIRALEADSPALPILRSQLFQDAIKLQASLRELEAWSDATLRAADARSKQRQYLIFGLFAGFIAIYGAFVSAVFRTVILKPLNSLGQTIQDLRDGRRGRAMVRADDEIGTVCSVFNALLDEQEDARKELQEMAERFRNVFQQAAVGMSIMAPDGTWLEVNQCLCDTLVVRRDEILMADGRAFTPEANHAEDAARIQAILAGKKNSDSWETRRILRDGRILDVRVTTALARDGAGRPLYFVTVTEDITERKRAADMLEEANRRLHEQAKALKRSNADLESYAWLASHDLREPLRMVTNYVAMIERRLGPNINDDMRDYIGFAIDGAKRMNDLIQSLLEYARVGQAETDVEQVALASAIAESVHFLTPAITESHATLTVADDLPTVAGVRGDLVRLFQNLIGNAIKYRAAGRDPLIAVSARRTSPEFWTVSVADNGIGIDPQYRERVFGIFQRLHARSEYEGTGIGLAVCKKIVERAGGDIWLDSTPGEGTTFHFTLPAPQRRR
ncbi:MAG: PAS domain S-box protein [Alphaproteobacteria bacterium]|nr:PAS domain S-box protein [Alphaproteobacteria bacterium]